MKRFIGYLLLSVSILISVFVGFVPTFSNVNAGADYAQGKEFIYQVSLKDETLNYINGTSSFADESALEDDIDDIVEEFKSRLEKANVSDAIVEKIDNQNDNSQSEKYYSIRVAYKAQYEQLYTAINDYLTFDWNLSVAITEDPFNFSQYDDSLNENSQALFKRGEVYVDTSDALPVIGVPLADPQKFNDDILQTVLDANNTDGTTAISGGISHVYADSTDESGEEDALTTSNYIYIVNNWTDKYDITKAVEDTNYYTAATENVLFRLNTTDLSSMFLDNDASDSTKINEVLKLDYTQYCPDLSNVTDQAVLQRIIYTLAQIEVNKLNASSYKFEITLLNESYPVLGDTDGAGNNIPAFVEQLKSQGKLLFSTLVIATISAFILLALFLSLHFGIASVGGIASISSVVLLSAALLSLFGVEFNIGTIVALIAVGIISTCSAAIYFKKVRELCYSGKALKKACSEAGKKTLMYHLDISVITLILGIVAYLNSNVIIMSMGAVLILGGIFNFLFSAVVLRVLYWLLANSSFINSHLKLLMIKKELIPDLSKDEKPTYFDSFKNETVTKRSKVISLIVFCVLLVGSIVAIPVTNSVTGNIYGAPNETVQNSQVYITYKVLSNDESLKGIGTTTEIKEKVLDHIYTFNSEAENPQGSLLKYSVVNAMYNSAIIDEEGNTELSFTYIIKLNGIIDNEDQYMFNDDVNTAGSLNEVIQNTIFEDISSEFNLNGVNDINVYLLSTTDFTEDNLNLELLYFVLISVAISTVYVALRFGLGKSIISLLFVGISTTITIGIYSALLVGVASTNTLSLVLIILLSYAMLLYYYATQRDILKENRNIRFDENYLAKRQELLSMNHALTFQTLIICLGLSSLIVITFVLSSTFSNVILISALIGFCITVLLIKTFILDFEDVNALIWNKTKRAFNFEKFNKKKKKNPKDNSNKGDGPQEATFIGIND